MRMGWLASQPPPMLSSLGCRQPFLHQETSIVAERVTLITGASAGIGTELARVFAANGHRLALVARRADRLDAIAGELASTCGKPSPLVIPCDLHSPEAGSTIEGALASAGVEVEYLVNNAGF